MFRSLMLSVAVVLLTGFCPLQARMLQDCDMASLWYQSEVVVEGEELGYTEQNYWQLGKVRVTRVHKGEDKVAVGDEIPVAVTTFSRKERSSDAEIDTKQVLLFLNWNQKGGTYLPAERYLPVGPGVKLIVDEENVVYGFQQLSNPGPYQPVRQGPERIDRSKLKKRKVSEQDQAYKQRWPEYWESRAYVYGRAELRKDLELAKRRVERLRAALDGHDLDALESYLLSTLPVALGWSESGRHSVRVNYADAVALAAAQEFLKRADAARIKAALEQHRGEHTYQVQQTLERALAGGR